MIAFLLFSIFAALQAQRMIGGKPKPKSLSCPSGAVCPKILRHLLRNGGWSILLCWKLMAPMGIRNPRHFMSLILLRFNRIPQLKLVRQMTGSNPAFHPNGGFFLTKPNKGPEHDEDDELEYGDLFEFFKSPFDAIPIFRYPSLGKNTPILKIVMHPSGRLFFMGCYDIRGRNSLVCYNFVHDYTDVRHTILSGHQDCVYAIAVHSDGRFMVSASSDHMGIVWNIPALADCSGISKTTYLNFGMCVFCLAFDPKKLIFAAGGNSIGIKMFELVPSGHVVREFALEGHTNYVYDVKFLNRDRLASASADNSIKFWDTTSRTCLQTFRVHQDSVRGLWFDSSERVMVSISSDKTMKVWWLSDLDATLVQNVNFKGHSYSIKEIVSDQSGAKLISAGSDDLSVLDWTLDEVKR
jgi:WD40 repeat protein